MLGRFIAFLRGRRTPPFQLPPEDELETTASGLRYSVVEEGRGERPAASDTVTVRYAGWLVNGRPFDASYPGTATFPLGRVIAGWTEGLQLMREGAVYTFVIPPELAYGERGAPPAIGPRETLVFRVELVRVG